MKMKNELTTLLTVTLLFCGVNSVFSQGIKSSIEYSYDDFESSDYETRISNLKEFAFNHYLYQKHKHDNENVRSWNEGIADGYDGGSGTPEDPYQIADAAQLMFFAQQLNQGEDVDACYILTNDIDLKGEDGHIWTPIGLFKGVFDGDGHTIANMHATTDTPDYVGLFGTLRDATIKNLNMTDAYVYYLEVNYTLRAGIVAGIATNTCFYNCDVQGVLSAVAMDGGGIAGNLTATADFNDTVFIKDCVNHADIYSVTNVGGIVGLTDNEDYNVLVENCTNYGMIDGGMSGGIIGDGEGFIIRNCKNYGKVGYILNSATTSGGMAGQGGNFVLIEDCVNYETAEITAGNAGGMIGAAMNSVIRRCGNRATITSNHYNTLFAGGICGSDGSISNCYNIGTITGLVNSYDGDNWAEYGAFAGITGTPTIHTVHNVYNAGEIIEPTAHINMGWYVNIIPAMLSDTAIINCYWTNNEDLTDKVANVETSSYTDIPESSRFNEGTTATSWILENPQYDTSDLLEALNAGAMGEAIWIEDTEGVNNGYPILKPLPEDTTGVNEFVAEDIKYVSVYPNPARDVVKVSTVNGQRSTVKVYNYWGILVDEIELDAEEIELDVSDYNPGIYFFNINGKTVKVVIEN